MSLPADLPDVPAVKDGKIQLPAVHLSPEKEQLVKELGEWIRKENLPETDEAGVVKFIHCVDYDLKKAQKCVKDFYTARNDCKELFSGWDPQYPDLKKTLQYMNIAVLPHLAPDGCRIVMYAMHEQGLTECSVPDIFRCLFMVLETVFLTEPTVAGVVFIQDMKNISIYQMIKAAFSMPAKISPYLEDGIPLKRNVNHMINCPKLIDYAMRMMRHIGRPEDHEKVQLHRGVDNFVELYGHIPREYLPSDYGGTLPTLTELHDMTIKRLEEFKDVFRILQLL